MKRLEAGGLLRRERDAEDERTVRISLTTQGKKLRGRAGGIADGVACAIGVNATEIAAIREPLRKILLRYRSVGSSPPPPTQTSKKRKKNPR